MTIATKRVQIKISQDELAKLLGVTRSTVAMWETGKSFPRADMLPQLAKILGCTIDDLFAPAGEEKTTCPNGQPKE